MPVVSDTVFFENIKFICTKQDIYYYFVEFKNIFVCSSDFFSIKA